MTWVNGTVPWGYPGSTIQMHLAQVITGEIPAGNGVTIPPSERWVREFVRPYPLATVTAGSVSVPLGPGLPAERDNLYLNVRGPGIAPYTTTNSWSNPISINIPATGSGTGIELFTDSIRTPPSTDIPSGDMANRCGYFTNIGVYAANNLATPNATSVRVTAPYSTSLASWGWTVRITLPFANSTPGDFSGTIVRYWTMNAETGAVISNAVDVATAAGGVATLANGLQVTISDPSGTITPGTSFVRAFQSGFMYGVDWWPMWHRTAGAATFTTPPPGVKGTDWDIVQLPLPNTGHATYSGTHDRSMLTYGLAIMTATGLGGGARYVVSFPMALGKMRIGPGATGGSLSLDVGESRKNVIVNSAALHTPLRVSQWLRAFGSSGAYITTASTVSYAMSVTRDGIVLAMAGDSISVGKVATAFYCAYEPTDPVYDKFPMAFNTVPIDYTTDQTGQSYFHPATQFPYWSQRRRQDGTTEAVRDWQTGWMAGEAFYYSASFNYSGSVLADVTSGPVPGGNATAPPALITPGMASYTTSSYHPLGVPARQNKPGHDDKWWLYPILLAEGDWTGTTAGATADEARIMRGRLTRFRFTPEDGFANWDEITDTTSGSKWLLLKPDYMGTGARIRSAANVFNGGVAIREM